MALPTACVGIAKDGLFIIGDNFLLFRKLKVSLPPIDTASSAAPAALAAPVTAVHK